MSLSVLKMSYFMANTEFQTNKQREQYNDSTLFFVDFLSLSTINDKILYVNVYSRKDSHHIVRLIYSLGSLIQPGEPVYSLESLYTAWGACIQSGEPIYNLEPIYSLG